MCIAILIFSDDQTKHLKQLHIFNIVFHAEKRKKRIQIIKHHHF